MLDLMDFVDKKKQLKSPFFLLCVVLRETADCSVCLELVPVCVLYLYLCTCVWL